MPRPKQSPSARLKARRGEASHSDVNNGSAFRVTKRRKDGSGPSRRRTKVAKVINKAPSDRLRVIVFGGGESGELGLGPAIHEKKSPEHAGRPRLNHILNLATVGVVQLAVGGMHCAALTHDGRVLTWGVNDSKALGRDTTWKLPAELPPQMTDLNPLESTPTEVRDLEDLGVTVTQVAATDNATFILTASGLVFGWGSFFGNDGAFGFLKEKIKARKRPATEDRFQSKPIQIAGLENVKELATGVNHVLALTHNGVVYAWGSGHQGELGRRLICRHQAEALVPRAVNLPRKAITKIFVGFNHSFALDSKGRVWAWGLNNFGQTGIPTDNDNLHVGAPQIVQGLAAYKIHHMAGGFHHSLACTQEGQVLAWGRCDDGQLGIDVAGLPTEDILFDSRSNPRIVSTPTVIAGIDASIVAAGIDNSLAVSPRGKVLSWGFSESCRTGFGAEDSVLRPSPLIGRAVDETKVTFAGCGGQFSVVAGPPISPREVGAWDFERHLASRLEEQKM